MNVTQQSTHTKFDNGINEVMKETPLSIGEEIPYPMQNAEEIKCAVCMCLEDSTRRRAKMQMRPKRGARVLARTFSPSFEDSLTPLTLADSRKRGSRCSRVRSARSPALNFAYQKTPWKTGSSRRATHKGTSSLRCLSPLAPVFRS